MRLRPVAPRVCSQGQTALLSPVPVERWARMPPSLSAPWPCQKEGLVPSRVSVVETCSGRKTWLGSSAEKNVQGTDKADRPSFQFLGVVDNSIWWPRVGFSSLSKERRLSEKAEFCLGNVSRLHALPV